MYKKQTIDNKNGNILENVYTGNILLFFNDGKYKLVKSNLKTHQAQSKDLINKWTEFGNDENVKAIIWSAQSVDVIQLFVELLIKKSSNKKLEEFLILKDLPNFLLENYKKYFIKNKYITSKDYNFKS